MCFQFTGLAVATAHLPLYHPALHSSFLPLFEVTGKVKFRKFVGIRIALRFLHIPVCVPVSLLCNSRLARGAISFEKREKVEESVHKIKGPLNLTLNLK